MNDNNSYGIDSIQILSDVDHIRLRPGMYVGDVGDGSFPISLFNEAFDNALDEAQSGTSPKTDIWISITENGDYRYSIRDYGRGIPLGKIKVDENTEMEALEVLITKTNSGAKFNSNTFRIRSGLNGVGLCCVCALSKEMKIITHRNGHYTEIISNYGEVTHIENGISKDSVPPKNGVFISFIADDSIYGSTEIPIDLIINRCKIAKSMGYSVNLFNELNEEVDIKIDSILDLIPEENEFNEYCHNIIKVEDEETKEFMIVGYKYTSDTKCKVSGYTNLLYNRYGGTHNNKVREIIPHAWQDFTKSSDLRWDDCTLGMRIVVAIFIENPAFSSQTKDKLSVPASQISKLVNKFKDEFYNWLDNNPEIRNGLIDRFSQYRELQNNLQGQKDIMKVVKIASHKDPNDKIKRSSSVVQSLIDCTSNKREGTELFVVEGNSAAGPVARPRDKKTQAVLPLRGKIKNVAYMDILKALSHETVLNIINSIGSGVGEASDPDKSRYERINIMTDSDEDGCVDGDTVVKSLDGNSYTFEELVNNKIKELWVYSKDENGNIVKALARNPHITKEVTELIELRFSDGYKFRCTTDHMILLDSNEYIPAYQITCEDNISSVYFEDSKVLPYYNNRIKSKNLIQLDDPIKVYDMEVPIYHNYMIETASDHHKGIIIHNSHITALVLIALVNIVPNIVKAGMVYSIEAPLYKYITKDGKAHYTSNFDEIDEWSYSHHKMQRFKGLGSMDDLDFKCAVLDRNNRITYQITYPDDIDEFNKMAGTSEGRGELLKQYRVLIDSTNEEDYSQYEINE